MSKTLSRWDLISASLRSFFIQASFNHERMIALGFCNCMMPFIRKMVSSPGERLNIIRRYTSFFNTHPYMVGWIVGATMNLEQSRIETGDVSEQQIERFRKRMGSSLAAIGDSLFWIGLKPFAVLIGILISFFNKPTGLLTFLLIYNVPHFYSRVKGVYAGYALGFSIAEKVTRRNFEQPVRILASLSALIAGCISVLFWLELGNFNLSSLSIFLLCAAGVYLVLHLRVSIPLGIGLLLGLTLIWGVLFN